jgi:ketosteroid isomerase-like protein
MNEPQALATVNRLLDAMNKHDLEGIVACFAPGYRNETPAHPPRSFIGSDQVRKNWSTILSSVPDQVVTLRALAVAGDEVWTELRMAGTQRDGTPHEMAGVTVLTIRDGLIDAARFYLEPVERASGNADEVIDHMFTEGARQ